MLQNKLRALGVVLLIVLICMGVGVLTHAALAAWPSMSDGKAMPEKPTRAPEHLAEPQANPTPIPAVDVIRAYMTNEALADLKFTGKPLIVSGKMVRVERGGILWENEKKKTVYTLWMSTSGHGDSQTHPMLSFRFTEDDRAELAKLQPGQTLTVQGKPEGNDKDRKIVYFFENKIIAVERNQ